MIDLWLFEPYEGCLHYWRIDKRNTSL